MSTVGRIGWMRALTKVFTRSRGTPAAALAMYCSRKVFVDTELHDYSICVTDKVAGTSGASHPRRALLREVRARAGPDPDVFVNRTRDAGVDRAGATDRRAEMDHVRLRTIGVAVGRDAIAVDHPSAGPVFAHLEGREPWSPRGLPQIPPLVAKRDAGAEAIVDEVLLVRLAVDDAEGDRAGRRIGPSAFLHRKAIVVGGDVTAAFLHAHDLRLVTR